MCRRIDAGREIAPVAAKAVISRRRLAKWYARWRALGEKGLLDHSSRPARTHEGTDLVEALRQQTKHGPARLADDLQRLHGVTLAPTTLHRILVRRGINQLRGPRSTERRAATEASGDLARIHAELHQLIRVHGGLNPRTVAVILDSQSVKGYETAGQSTRGFDGGKLINGRMRQTLASAPGTMSRHVRVVAIPAIATTRSHSVGSPGGRASSRPGRLCAVYRKLWPVAVVVDLPGRPVGVAGRVGHGDHT
ncbi:helix-turn-helix domain-containing protein [Streptomyces sp. NPDC053069]|uniref:helix-turn-helix domain-containing protein n=1 Tax=Streptomyces sp. NPDC053069 TaxID=3365695 RepID=UPI0037D389EA